MGLQYQEHIESDLDKKRNIEIECLCPRTSGTIKKQTEILDPMGLTLVAIIENDRGIFTSVFKKLRSIGDFKESPNLHLTMLGIFDDGRKSNPLYEDLTKKSIDNYFESNLVGKFQIRFDKVRPGTYYKPQKNQYGNREQMYKLGDGTVFANGDMLHSDTKRFNEVDRDLGRWLREDPNLGDIFPSDFEPKFNALWCTLDYFVNIDFRLTRDMEKIFLSNELLKFTNSISVGKLWIVKYPTRNLKRAKKIWSTRLG